MMAEIELSADEKAKIERQEEYRVAVREKLNTSSRQGKLLSFVNSSFGLWLLSAVFITGAGSALTWYQNRENERIKKQEIVDADKKSVKERVERLDLEIAYRLSTTQSNLQVISVQRESVKEATIRTKIRQAAEPIFSPANGKTPPLYPEFASYSGLALVAELRRHVMPGEKEKLSKVITGLSGLNGELGNASSTRSANEMWVAGRVISTMGAAKRWNLGFFYTDCSEKKPFC